MKRVMCVYLPAWPLQRLWHERPELRGRPVALCDHVAGSPRIVFCSTRERKSSCGVNGSARIQSGMPVAEALAIDPDLHVEQHDPDADSLALGRLAEWAGRFSPIVAIEGGESRPGTLARQFVHAGQ